ncbi:hypothetical protein BDA96_05G073300 [Sorghum bicolor]|uniref:Uncharacterized protein n=1 Tax=Sorghum bicolor TaxID=4558 RepID=A0A921QVG2_SORBI|nr:hypothetical protein BDA96_05G073300 [Sorghum bicolor]
MARLTACFVLSGILLLATGICSGNGQIVEEPFPTNPVTGCLQFRPDGHLPLTWPVPWVFEFLAKLPPLRIISKGDPSLSIAADDNGNVFLAKTNCSDLRQLWVQHFPYPGENRFALVNLAKEYEMRAPMILEDGPYPMKLGKYAPLDVPAYALWTQDTPLFCDGFYKIRSCYKDERLVLDGLHGNVHEGTVVGAYPADHSADNVLWKMEGFLSNHP